MNVTIIGVGALGSHLVQFLRNEDIQIHVRDFDRVEQRNVRSQFHSKASVGKKKTDSIKQSMNFLYGRKVNVVGHKLTKDNDHQLLVGSGLIVDCLDNTEAREIVQGYARTHEVPCLHGALAADGGFGRVIWDEDFVIDGEGVEGAATCEGGEFLPFIALVSAYLAQSVQFFVKEGRKVGYSISPTGTIRI